MPDPAKDTRTRILSAASEVFSIHGVRGGGLDRIAAQAGVTKRTLYYHFRSKDDLIAACLDGWSGPVLDAVKDWLEARQGSPEEKVGGLVTALAEASARPRWRGCGFLRAAFELAELPGHPARAIAAAHKRALEAVLAAMLRQAGLGEAEAKARRLMLVLDGTAAQLLVHRDPAYAAQAIALVRLVLEDGARPPAPGHRLPAGIPAHESDGTRGCARLSRMPEGVDG